MSLKTANNDFKLSVTIERSTDLEICSISVRDLILASGSVSSAVPSSASLYFLLSLTSSAVRSFFTSSWTKHQYLLVLVKDNYNYINYGIYIHIYRRKRLNDIKLIGTMFIQKLLSQQTGALDWNSISHL